jgi:hypothetical protein
LGERCHRAAEHLKVQVVKPKAAAPKPTQFLEIQHTGTAAAPWSVPIAAESRAEPALSRSILRNTTQVGVVLPTQGVYFGSHNTGPNYNVLARLGYRLAPHVYFDTFASANNARNISHF